MQVRRWRLRGERMVRDGVVIDGIPAPGSIHVSARVRFGPDGAMYVGTGDVGEGRRAQDPGSLNGKILRIPPGAQRSDGVRPAVRGPSHGRFRAPAHVWRTTIASRAAAGAP